MSISLHRFLRRCHGSSLYEPAGQYAYWRELRQIAYQHPAVLTHMSLIAPQYDFRTRVNKYTKPALMAGFGC